MDDMFWRANKYSMLEDDVCVATQHILVIGQVVRNNAVKSPKPSSQRRLPSRGQGKQRQLDQFMLTPLTVS